MAVAASLAGCNAGRLLRRAADPSPHPAGQRAPSATRTAVGPRPLGPGCPASRFSANCSDLLRGASGRHGAILRGEWLRGAVEGIPGGRSTGRLQAAPGRSAVVAWAPLHRNAHCCPELSNASWAVNGIVRQGALPFALPMIGANVSSVRSRSPLPEECVPDYSAENGPAPGIRQRGRAFD